MKKLFKTMLTALTFSAIMPLSALAASPAPAVPGGGGDIQSSVLWTGLQKLVADITSILMIAGPAICLLLAGYFFIRKMMVDVHEQKEWNKRIIGALISGGAVLLVSVLFNVLIGYFQ